MARPLPGASRPGLHGAPGAALLIAAAGVFAAIAVNVAAGDRLAVLDAQVATWLHAHAGAALTRAMLAVSTLNSTLAIGAYATVLGTVQALRRQWWSVLALVACVGGGMLLNVAVKLAFQRARPVFDDPVLTLATYSFPSGHVAAATVFYGFGVAWVFGRTASLRWRLLAIAGMVIAVVLVAFSRMLLGVHYLSDVVAAAAEGVAWLVLCLGAGTALRRRAEIRSARP